MSAVQRVFTTGELLSLVLLHLDHQTLLVAAQRVCKAWLAEVRSPVIQHRLFFRPLAAHQPHTKVLNPLLAEAFPSCFRTLPTEVLPLPGMFDIQPQFEESPAYLKRGEDNPFFRDGASWLSMHVSDPPTTNVCWHLAVEDRDIWNEVECKEFPDGLRMQELYGMVLRHSYFSAEDTDFAGTYMVLWAPVHDTIQSVDAIVHRGRGFCPGFHSDMEDEEDPNDTIDDMEAEVLLQLSVARGSAIKDKEEEVIRFWDDCGMNFGPYKEFRDIVDDKYHF